MDKVRDLKFSTEAEYRNLQKYMDDKQPQKGRGQSQLTL